MNQQQWIPGKNKPIGYLIACFADASAARGALDTLREAGFADNDLASLNGTDGYAEIQRVAGSTPLRRFTFALENATGDEVTGRAAVIEELKGGHSVVFVYTPDDGITNKAHQIVREAHAYKINRLGYWVNTNLS